MNIIKRTFKLLVLIFLLVSVNSCTQTIDYSEEISKEKIEKTIQSFTVNRLRLHLHSNASPPSNETILRQSAIENSLNPGLLIRSLKAEKPDLFKSLFIP